MNIGMFHYLFIALIIFLIGLIGSLILKNIIKILVSIEIMLLGININFITFATFCDNLNFNGYIFSLFYVGLGAVELAVAIFIFYLMFQKKESNNIEDFNEL